MLAWAFEQIATNCGGSWPTINARSFFLTNFTGKMMLVLSHYGSL